MSYGELTLAGQEWTWNSDEEATAGLQMRWATMKTLVLDLLEGGLAGPGEEERKGTEQVLEVCDFGRFSDERTWIT